MLHCSRGRLLACAFGALGAFILYRLFRKRQDRGLSYEIGHTWDGRPLRHEKARVTFTRGTGDVIEMHVQAPFYNDPKAPSGEQGEAFPGLWDFEVVEAFFLSDSGKYLEVELCPHGQHLLLLLNGKRNMFKDQLPIKFDYSIRGKEWFGTAYLPLEYFPPGVRKFNAYAIHGSDDNRKYEAYQPVPGSEPDFHRLQYFVPLDFSSLAPENASSSYSSRYWS